MSDSLDWKEYDYTVQTTRYGRKAYRALIPIEVSCRTSSEVVAMHALIDTGTDNTLFDSGVATSLEIKRDFCMPTTLGGLGNEVQGFICNVNIYIPDFDHKMEVPASFTDGVVIDGILGQSHFFMDFIVRFERHKKKFYLALARPAAK